MTPLDLTTQPPRSCRIEVAGIPYLARAIDKLRAELPGGKLGDYVTLYGDFPTVSALFYKRTGIDHDALLGAVTTAKDDDEVGAWCREHTDEEKLAKWRAQILGTRLTDLPELIRDSVRAAHPATESLPEDALLVDMFDAEDVRAFANA